MEALPNQVRSQEALDNLDSQVEWFVSPQKWI